MLHGTKNCTKCKTQLPLNEFYTTGKKVSGAPKYNSWCKPCVKTKMASYHQRTWGEQALQFTAHKRTKTPRAYLAYLRAKAKKRNAEDVVSVDYLEGLWDTQQGKCALTGWDMTMTLAQGVVPTNCSIDRINSDLGYQAGNVQLVCRIANICKQDLSTDAFTNMCRAVAGYQNV